MTRSTDLSSARREVGAREKPGESSDGNASHHSRVHH